MGCSHSTSSEVVENSRRGCFKRRKDRSASSDAVSRMENLTSDLVQHSFVQDINTVFKFDNVLGKGAFGYVSKAKNLQTGKVNAVKVVDLKNQTDKNALRNEINMLKSLHHPNIVRVSSSYEDKKNMYMVMQLCSGQELFDHLYKHKKVFSEGEIRQLISGLLRAIAYLHANGISHRDLKLENLLLEDENDMSSLKLCDFGFSKFCKKGQRMTKTLGTVDYVSPEVLLGNYDSKTDLWSVGVICYELFACRSPFRADTRDGTLMKILDAKLSFSEVRWKRTSKECIEFIKRLVVEDVDARASAAEALALPWIVNSSHSDASNHSEDNSEEQQVGVEVSAKFDISEEVIDQIRKNLSDFASCRELKKMAMLTVSLLGVEDRVMEPIMSSLFHRIDLNKTGVITRSEFCNALQTIFKIDKTEGLKLFTSVDQSQNNVISYVEFLAATLNPANVSEVCIKEAFKKFESDGVISKEGLQAVLKRKFSPTDVQEMIASADINGDGQLNYEEFKAIFMPETPTDGFSDDIEVQLQDRGSDGD